MFCSVVFLNILFSQVVLSINWEHKIYVSTTGINDTTCWTSGQHTPCATINLALKGLQHNSTVIYITPGIYTLEYGQETQLKDKYQLAIIGNVPDSPGEQQKVVIKCSPLIGLSFLWSGNITLQSITLHGCGGVHVSTSRNMSSQSFELLMFQVAVYMLYCKNVHIMDVVIGSSNGTGLTMYNTVGNVTISGCVFKENGVGISYGGGGLQIEWSYCDPENEWDCPEEGPSPVDNNNDSLYNVINCIFTSNMAQGGSLLSRYYKLSNQARDSYMFGRGGGVSVIFKGQARNNKIIMYYNLFQDNQADHGGGLYIGYYDNAYNNSIEISHTIVTNNSNPTIFDLSLNADRGGGGVKIMHASMYNTVIKQLVNVIEMISCNISNNTGIIGGGLMIESGSIFNLHLSNIVFVSNIAYQGSACFFTNGIDFSQHLDTIKLSKCIFRSNEPVCDNINGVYSFSCSGTLYSRSVPISFNGINIFSDNRASAIEVHGSVITINPGTKMTFIGNDGSHGGAIALYECSYIVLYNETKLIFINNTATSKGGAIYTGLCNTQRTCHFQLSCCFVRYYISNVHPDNWITELNFSSNEIINKYAPRTFEYKTPNAIYATSLSSCWWPLLPNTSDITLSSIKRTLCWNNWNYNCTTSIQSGVAFLNESVHMTTIQPGARLAIIVYDGTGNIATEKLQICLSLNELTSMYVYCKIASKPIIYQFSQYQNCSNIDSSCYLHVTTLHEALLEANYKISFDNCTWPFHLSQIDQDNLYSCVITIPGLCCSENCFSSKTCTIGSTYTRTLLGYCLSNYISQPVIGRCPLSRQYITQQFQTYDNYISTVLNDIVNNGEFPYMGRLNGACKTNSCVPINSPFLVCANRSTTWDYEYVYQHDLLLFFIIEMLPLTLFISILIVFNIKLTNGSYNGYVFYCQILYLSITRIEYPFFCNNDDCSFVDNYLNDIQVKLFNLPQSIWNLNFIDFVPFVPYVCISCKMGSLGAIAFWYVIAAYPFLLLLFLYGWITMYNKGFRCVVSITRPLHRLLARFWRMTNIQPSFTHSISSIYVLCFTQFAATSLKLLHYTKWYSLSETETGIAFYYDGTLDYFGYPHAVLGILAIIILIAVVFIPMVYLLLHPFKWFHKILDWCRLKRSQFVITLVDDYTGAFKNGCDNTNDYRYSAGLYLLLRIVIICLYYIPIQQYHIFLGIQTSLCAIAGGSIMIFRPYRKNIHNFSEFLIFSILALISGISLSSENGGGMIIFLMYLPPGVALLCCIYWIIKKIASCCFYCRPIKQRQTETNEEYILPLDDNDTFADRVMNPHEYDERHVNTVQYESPLSEMEPLITHFPEMTHHISINPVSTTSTRSRHSGSNRSYNSNSRTSTRLLLDEQSEF